MKKILILLTLVLFAMVMVSCKSTQPIPGAKTETNHSLVTKEVIHDTVFQTKPDSSYYKAWLECKDGKVVLKGKPEEKKGKHLNAPKVTIKDNYITVDCRAEAQKLFAKWKDIYVKENKETTITKPVFVERDLTWWQKFQIWCGRVFLALLLLVGISWYLKFKKII